MEDIFHVPLAMHILGDGSIIALNFVRYDLLLKTYQAIICSWSYRKVSMKVFKNEGLPISSMFFVAMKSSISGIQPHGVLLFPSMQGMAQMEYLALVTMDTGLRWEVGMALEADVGNVFFLARHGDAVHGNVTY